METLWRIAENRENRGQSRLSSKSQIFQWSPKTLILEVDSNSRFVVKK
jgi:hypothetical protein